ncbi:MAG: NTP transferase domain-containing protein [Planctomycetaceae bacterium]|nr:NTP transferase domain-containing protein [Planctomycetaceae bacterium]
MKPDFGSYSPGPRTERDTMPVGAVLAGGQSRRMGRDKALLRVSGTTLLERALAQLAPIVSRLFVATGAELRYAELLDAANATAVLDRPTYGAGAGPLAGLEAILNAAAAVGATRVVLLACDLPHVETGHLETLLAASRGVDVTIGCDAGGDQPLVGVYDLACMPAVQGALARGERRADSFFAATGPVRHTLRVRRVDAEVLAPGVSTFLFHNLNGPEDVAGGPQPLAALLR